MKRAEKIALLTKVLQGEVNPNTVKQLRGADTRSPFIVLFHPHKDYPQPDDELTLVSQKGDQVILYKDFEKHARRLRGDVAFFLPHKNK